MDQGATTGQPRFPSPDQAVSNAVISQHASGQMMTPEVSFTPPLLSNHPPLFVFPPHLPALERHRKNLKSVKSYNVTLTDEMIDDLKKKGLDKQTGSEPLCHTGEAFVECMKTVGFEPMKKKAKKPK